MNARRSPSAERTIRRAIRTITEADHVLSARYTITGAAAWPWGFWFRVRGYGLRVAITPIRLFSERNGLRRVLRVGWFVAEPLRPERG